MKISAQQRAELRSLGNRLKPIVFIGKDGVTKNTASSIDEALSNRELIKIKLLQACPDSRKEAADKLAKLTDTAQVQQIGRTFLLYRPFPEEEK